MRLNCDYFKNKRQARRIAECKTWRRVFAWRPVRVEGGGCCWLEVVERRRQWHPYGITDLTSAPIRVAYRVPTQGV